MRKIQILGTGCPKCEKLADLTIQAANELGLEYEIEKIKDINEIIKMGVMVTPALAINGEIKISGKCPSLEEIKACLNGGESQTSSCDCGGCCK